MFKMQFSFRIRTVVIDNWKNAVWAIACWTWAITVTTKIIRCSDACRTVRLMTYNTQVAILAIETHLQHDSFARSCNDEPYSQTNVFVISYFCEFIWLYALHKIAEARYCPLEGLRRHDNSIVSNQANINRRQSVASLLIVHQGTRFLFFWVLSTRHEPRAAMRGNVSKNIPIHPWSLIGIRNRFLARRAQTW